MQHNSVSRRNFAVLCGAAAAGAGLAQGIGGAFAQTAIKPFLLPTLPTVGNIVVKGAKVTTTPLGVGIAANHGMCTMELSSGIHIQAKVELEPKPGSHPAYFGTLGFLQIVRFKYWRAPPNLTGVTGVGWACAQSSGKWDLDGQYPYLKHSVRCRSGLNRIDLADDPGVPVEDATMPYETVKADPLAMFQTWLIWEATDDNNPVSPTNRPRPHVLARVDWDWKGIANDVNMSTNVPCASTTHSGHGWVLSGQDAGVRGVFIGKAAGIPPTLKSLPTANPNAWGPAC